MAKNKSKLTQTKSNFTLKGIVDGVSKGNAFRSGEVGKGKNKGKATQALSFWVQTSKQNKVRVELFGMEPDFVYFSKDGKTEKGEKRETKQIPYSQRNKAIEGFSLIGINVGLEKDDNGKNITKTFVDYDAAEYIYENLNDGDSVFINGQVTISEYTNKEGKTSVQVKYSIRKLYLESKPIDFDAEGFVETNAFEQEIVIVDAEEDKKEGIIIVTGRVINYGDKFCDTQFIVRPDGNEKIAKMGKAFLKAKFGDFIKVAGNIINRAEVEEAEEDTDNPFAGEKPEGLKGQITTYTSELRITNGEGYEKEKYSEEDFEIEELVDQDMDFSGDKGNGDKMEDISDDDLPF